MHASRVAVRINPKVWRDEVERFDERSPARIAAERERRQLENEGVSRALLERCAEECPALVLVAFGERHPRRGTRSVYERAHKRFHGRYPDQ